MLTARVSLLESCDARLSLSAFIFHSLKAPMDLINAQTLCYAEAFRYHVERLPSEHFLFRLPQLEEMTFEAPSLEVGRAVLEERIVAALEARIKAREPLPQPERPRAGEGLIELSPIVRAKLLLIVTANERHVYPAELARRLDITSQEAQRIMRLSHATKLDTIGAAFRAMNLDIVIAARPR